MFFYSHVIKVGVRIRNVCLVCISMTFEPTGNMCELLLVGVAHMLLGQSAMCNKVMANRTLKEFQEGSEVLNTSSNKRIWSFFETAILCFTSHCSLILINLAADFTG